MFFFFTLWPFMKNYLLFISLLCIYDFYNEMYLTMSIPNN